LTSTSTNLLTEAPVGGHFAQLHPDPEGFAGSVARFVETGLARGSGIVLVATPESVARIFERLQRSKLDPERLRTAGQLAVYDAAAMLDQILRDGMPSWEDFRRVVGGVLESMQACRRLPLRIYGEMVGILWRQGNAQAAIKLEEHWNELAKVYPFCLLCGYTIDSQRAECYHGPLHEIGRTHSGVLATDDDDRFRDALDLACLEVLGSPLSQLVSLSVQEDRPGESRLPAGQRTVLWILRNMPSSSADLLERARRHFKRGGR
jgi:hypothetical protein